MDDSATGGLFGDAVKQADEYAYDGNGNMAKDLNKNISNITYNCLNLPGKVTFTDGGTIAYTYAADGTKLGTVRTIGGATTTTDYCGNAVYENGTLKYLLTEEGYITVPDKKYHYYLRDHQGNNRVVVDQAGNVEEVNHYYPFGGMFASTDVQPYKYNGKEWDKTSKWYDYGARNYDAALGRFIAVDPMAENYYSVSPYGYCLDNPVNMIDPDGKDGIFIAFPEYKISTPIGHIENLGHAGILLIDNKTGFTKYYEYGRYDAEGKGIVRTFEIPNVKIDVQNRPTAESLNKVLQFISERAGHSGRIEGAYVTSDDFESMNNYALKKLEDNDNPKRREYSLFNNNCGTFAIDVLKQDIDIKDKMPSIIDPRPNSIVEELQDKFDVIKYNPEDEPNKYRNGQ